MANRVVHADVIEIIETSITDTTPFITAANRLLAIALDSDDQVILGSDLLEEIEKFLAAHFVALKDPIEVRAKAGASEAQFMLGSNTGEGLRLTPYGQTACALDITGKLAILGKKQGMSIKAIDLEL